MTVSFQRFRPIDSFSGQRKKRRNSFEDCFPKLLVVLELLHCFQSDDETSDVLEEEDL